MSEIEDGSMLRAFFPEELEYLLKREALEVVERFDREGMFSILAQKRLSEKRRDFRAK